MENPIITASKSHKAIQNPSSVMRNVLACVDSSAENQDLDARRTKIWQTLKEAILIERTPSRFSLHYWMHWLTQSDIKSESQFLLPSQHILSQNEYWRFLHAGLRNGAGELQKFSLYLLQKSTALAKEDINIPLFCFSAKHATQFEREYAKFFTIFETIVIGHYVNQLRECLKEVPHNKPYQIGIQNATLYPRVPNSWWISLFHASLKQTNSEVVRKTVGIFVTEQRFERLRIDNEFRDFISEAFLPWALQGSLLERSIIRNSRQVLSTHGNLLANFIQNILQAGIDFDTTTYYAKEILTTILEKEDRVYSCNVGFVLSGFHKSEVKFPRDISNFALKTLDLIHLSTVERELFVYLIKEISEDKNHVETRAHVQERLYLRESDSIHSKTVEQIERHIEHTQHRCLEHLGLSQICQDLAKCLVKLGDINSGSLQNVLHAVWEQVDAHEYRRVDLEQLPRVFFAKATVFAASGDENFLKFLLTVLDVLFDLCQTKTYLWNPVAESIRRVYLEYPASFELLHMENFLWEFATRPPVAMSGYLLEVALAESILDKSGKPVFNFVADETYGHACMFDVMNRLRLEHQGSGLRIVDLILSKPWKKGSDKPGGPAQWKRTSLMQALVILVNACIHDAETARRYRNRVLPLLHMEANKRLKYLVELAVVSLFSGTPGSINDDTKDELLPILEGALDATSIAVLHSPRHVNSVMRVFVALTRVDGMKMPMIETLLALLTGLAAFDKIAIRLEAQRNFPIVLNAARSKGGPDFVESPAYKYLEKFVCMVEKAEKLGKNIHVERIDPQNDMTLANIFQGAFLKMDSLGRFDSEVPTLEDFNELFEKDSISFQDTLPPMHVEMGQPPPHAGENYSPGLVKEKESPIALQLQTKSYLPAWQPEEPNIPDYSSGSNCGLIASLIKSPPNVGGICRAAECFGVTELHVDDTSVLENMSFKNVAVSSERHLRIVQTPEAELVTMLQERQNCGFQIVGLEQTNNSVLLGAPGGVAFGEKVMFVLGAERTGIPAPVLAVCDVCVEIEQFGVVRSLNVQTAAAVLLHEWRKWRKWRKWGKERMEEVGEGENGGNRGSKE